MADAATTPVVRQVVIIGSGPAAHTAAIYTARAMLQPLLFEGFMAANVAAGGQLTTTTEVENFPGFPGGISGPALMERMRKQSEECGTQIETKTVANVDLSQRPFKVTTEDGETVLANTIILATGATAKRLGLPGEESYWQRGMSACAVCDGALPCYRNKPLVVMGGGDSACEEATYLTKYGSKVYILVRRDQMRASKVMAERAQSNPKIQVLWNTVPVAITGDERKMTAVTLEDTTNGTRSELPADGFFYAIGHVPNTAFLNGQLQTDEAGYVVTTPGTTRTSVAGVFAAGDVQDHQWRQAITAAGTGCMAALEAERFLNEVGH